MSYCWFIIRSMIAHTIDPPSWINVDLTLTKLSPESVTLEPYSLSFFFCFSFHLLARDLSIRYQASPFGRQAVNLWSITEVVITIENTVYLIFPISRIPFLITIYIIENNEITRFFVIWSISFGSKLVKLLLLLFNDIID